jgi:lysophospholipase L1-like esterase
VQANRIGAEVINQQPDMIVLASGLNDLMHGRSPDETTGILRQFIANARAARPNVGGTVQHSYTYNLTPGATYDFKIQGVRRA